MTLDFNSYLVTSLKKENRKANVKYMNILIASEADDLQKVSKEEVQNIQ